MTYRESGDDEDEDGGAGGSRLCQSSGLLGAEGEERENKK